MKELYETILSREDVPYTSLKNRKRIAVVKSNGDLDVMKIDEVGYGRPTRYEKMRYMAVAKVCPGQASMTLRKDGSVRINKLMEVISEDSDLGGLAERLSKAYWINLDKRTMIKKVTKSEMKKIQGGIP